MDYFEKGGTYFRRRDLSLPAVNEVWNGSAWVTYQGDRFAPVFFGDRIAASELPPAARPYKFMD